MLLLSLLPIPRSENNLTKNLACFDGLVSPTDFGERKDPVDHRLDLSSKYAAHGIEKIMMTSHS